MFRGALTPALSQRERGWNVLSLLERRVANNSVSPEGRANAPLSLWERAGVRAPRLNHPAR